METAFHYDLGQKQLNLKLRESLTSQPGLELKGKGLFNTVTGTLGYSGTLTAGVSVGKNVKGAGSTPLKLATGVAVSGSDTKTVPKPLLHVRAKKAISLFDGPRTVASVKAFGNVDVQTGKVVDRTAVVKLSYKWLGFTKKQDLKLTGGVDLDWPVGAREPKPTPFVVVRENNWALHYRRQRWSVTYDL